MKKSGTLYILEKLCSRLVKISDEDQDSINRFVPDTGFLSKFIKKPPIYDRSTSAGYWFTETEAYTYEPFLKSLKAQKANFSAKEAELLNGIKDYIGSLASLLRYIEDWGQLIFYKKNLLAGELKKPIKNYRFPMFEHYKWLIGFYWFKTKQHKVRKQFRIRYKELFGQDLNISL